MDETVLNFFVQHSFIQTFQMLLWCASQCAVSCGQCWLSGGDGSISSTNKKWRKQRAAELTAPCTSQLVLSGHSKHTACSHTLVSTAGHGCAMGRTRAIGTQQSNVKGCVWLICLRMSAALPTGAPGETAELFTADSLILTPELQLSASCWRWLKVYFHSSLYWRHMSVWCVPRSIFFDVSCQLYHLICFSSEPILAFMAVY